MAYNILTCIIVKSLQEKYLPFWKKMDENPTPKFYSFLMLVKIINVYTTVFGKCPWGHTLSLNDWFPGSSIYMYFENSWNLYQ